MQANHPALRGGTGRPVNPMRSSVLLSVQCEYTQTSEIIKILKNLEMRMHNAALWI